MMTEKERTIRVAGALLVTSLPAIARSRPRRRQIAVTLLGATAIRLLAALAVMRVLDRWYADTSDARDYDAGAVEIASALRSRNLRQAMRLARTRPWDTHYELPVGTNLIRLLNGGIYATVGRSKPVAYLTFSWVGYWGLACFQRAFALAKPDADQLLFARLLFLHPSTMFFTSNIGKEPLTALGLGLGTLGAANALTGSAKRSALQLTGAAAITVAARPQIPLYLGLGRGYDLDDRREAEPGGSWFEPPAVSNSPLSAAVSVLFRPYPRETRNTPGRFAAGESAALVLLTLVRAPRLIRGLRPDPFTVFVVAALGGSIAILSPLSNSGLLVRERAPVVPLYLMLLCATPAKARID
jgi:hypothetical protein